MSEAPTRKPRPRVIEYDDPRWALFCLIVHGGGEQAEVYALQRQFDLKSKTAHNYRVEALREFDANGKRLPEPVEAAS